MVLFVCILCSYHFNYSADDESVKVVEYLVKETNCDVNSETNSGKTPLDIARRWVYVQLLFSILSLWCKLVIQPQNFNIDNHTVSSLYSFG